MKFCHDCKWSKKKWFDAMECHHPRIGPMPESHDRVTGRRTKAGWWPCDHNRMYIDPDCGNEGNLWEQRS